MPKTKNAFALGDFDAQRILQRRWFRDFDLAIGKDEDLLRSFLNVYEKPTFRIIPPEEEGYLEGLIENLDKLTRLAARALSYETLLESHMRRLNGIQKVYVEQFMSTEDKTYKEKFERTTELIKNYREVLNLITALREEISLKEQLLKDLQKNYYTKIFATRLRQARKAAGLTQAALAEKLGIKRGTYNAYEIARNEPNISVLALVAREFNRPLNWFLGL